jgi:hypothetical protein
VTTGIASAGYDASASGIASSVADASSATASGAAWPPGAIGAGAASGVASGVADCTAVSAAGRELAGVVSGDAAAARGVPHEGHESALAPSVAPQLGQRIAGSSKGTPLSTSRHGRSSARSLSTQRTTSRKGAVARSPVNA